MKTAFLYLIEPLSEIVMMEKLAFENQDWYLTLSES